MGRLDGKVCIVTGASAGIGRATAELFCREGATKSVLETWPKNAANYLAR